MKQFLTTLLLVVCAAAQSPLVQDSVGRPDASVASVIQQLEQWHGEQRHDLEQFWERKHLSRDRKFDWDKAESDLRDRFDAKLDKLMVLADVARHSLLAKKVAPMTAQDLKYENHPELFLGIAPEDAAKYLKTLSNPHLSR